MKHIKTLSQPRAALAQQGRALLFDLFVDLLIEFELAKTRKATGM
jgi:hypothetical protein